MYSKYLLKCNPVIDFICTQKVEKRAKVHNTNFLANGNEQMETISPLMYLVSFLVPRQTGAVQK